MAGGSRTGEAATGVRKRELKEKGEHAGSTLSRRTERPQAAVWQFGRSSARPGAGNGEGSRES